MRKSILIVFIQNEYVVISYDSESPSKDQLVCGPLMICDGFPELYSTKFSDRGIDFAFGCHDVDEAFLFSCYECTKIKYSPITFTGEVIIENRRYKEMFPCLKKINFGDPLYTAAFESTVANEAYILYNSRYVLFNYSEKKLTATGLITELFPCLCKTFFTSDIEAAFASHKRNQVYLFKGNSYVLIQYNPANADDSKIIFGPEEVVPTKWPSLSDFVPYKNIGFDSAEPRTWTALWGSNGYIKAPLGGEVSEEIHDKYGPFAINID
ncbi:albumin-2-like [Chenopodium quinoa]|uniref:albumin-2-like n=1 Tax=Chenopodium quinoa TaxID=63459 RepID=UPI000B795DD0|nr:albumin-2-like [Chenopodium quinoa]